eukprot:TRINITY_DN19701_c0_g1_i1.p2 TRINITY_DN19701_c0_g1~~TRINITY_DN19701_c0_g1_i1.p2  ORF type:complete len:189 (-),score=45.35 TRINITY_DN19701_c0_g1_i1:514-1080(-)
MGGGVDDTRVFKGFALPKDSAGTVKHVKNAKVLVLASGLEASQTETSSTVLMTSADELMGFTKGEEEQMHDYVKEIVAGGANVVVAGGTVSEIAMHYVREVRHHGGQGAQQVPAAQGLPRHRRRRARAPRQDHARGVGSCDSVSVEEVGSNKVTFSTTTRTGASSAPSCAVAAPPTSSTTLSAALTMR